MPFMGIATVNVAKMVIHDFNDRGGLLGRPVELFVDASATEHSAAGPGHRTSSPQCLCRATRD